MLYFCNLCIVFLMVVDGAPMQEGSGNRRSSTDLKDRLQRARALLKEAPLIDGHNDVPLTIRATVQDQLEKFPFDHDLSKEEPWASRNTTNTDLPRLKAGGVGGQFLATWIPCESEYKNALVQGLEQIDVTKRLVKKYPRDLELATTAQGIMDAFRHGKIAILIGVEGGHMIDSSLGALRSMYELGVRYLTLTHACDTPWSEMSGNEGQKGRNFTGLTDWGKNVVTEMNRLGMMVDLAHVSKETMVDALDTSVAPVIFSHSNARAVCNNTRNVPDDVLRRIKNNGGIVMVTFLPYFVSCSAVATLENVVEHINHIRDVAGIDHVGIGSDFDGIDMQPVGLEDVSKYPQLIAELMKDPTWTDTHIKKLIGGNILRVMREVEEVRDSLKYRVPVDVPIPDEDLSDKMNACRNLEFAYQPFQPTNN